MKCSKWPMGQVSGDPWGSGVPHRGHGCPMRGFTEVHLSTEMSPPRNQKASAVKLHHRALVVTVATVATVVVVAFIVIVIVFNLFVIIVAFIIVVFDVVVTVIVEGGDLKRCNFSLFTHM